MRIIESSNRRGINRLIERRQEVDPNLARRVTRIISTVRRSGDKALLRYAKQFDQLEKPVEVSPEELRTSLRSITPDLRSAMRTSATNIRKIARRQLPRTWRETVTQGVEIQQRVTPLSRVGCYVPAGRYPLPSSLLMTAIPAAVAGVPEVIVVCPRPDPTILAAAAIAKATKVFRLGGAHAIAALAYGTTTVPKVDKIVGPGNAYVATAKAQVSLDCPIDFYAGPTEIVVLTMAGNPAWIAADLIAQAEHDPDARSIVVTPNRSLAREITDHVKKQLPARGPALSSMRRFGTIVIVKSIDEAVGLVNKIAPEHLVCDRSDIARRTTRAGTILIGPYGAQAAGDYATGSNHVLPTGGAAQFRGGLSASDFVHIHSVQRISRKGLSTLSPSIVSLAEAEGLTAHAESVKVRMARAKSGGRANRPIH
ncbi:MAG: histidinol dehydrogenase [Acidobacteria bacterium]|nr:histidinol dehydrogenase [Acidobacteriota bacterium]|tara:strand:- start:22719 stop:23993 length:1275 start_codon:yes stop_codon:yes gene_type:complete